MYDFQDLDFFNKQLANEDKLRFCKESCIQLEF